MNAPLIEQDTLFYPYANFPSEAWLKATLLLSPHVYRMVAEGYQPRLDTPFMREARGVRTNGVPLVEHPQLWSKSAGAAQELLLNRLKKDIKAIGPPFLKKFGKSAARAVAKTPEGFQMHRGKMLRELELELNQLELAWTPQHPDDHGYLELHPAIGQAVLGSIAVACAADRGLSVIGDAADDGCQRLNQLVPASDFNAVYDEFVHGKKRTPVSEGGTHQAAVDILLYNHSDASSVTLKDLVDLSKDRDPIRKLKARLQELAEQIPPMLDSELRASRLEQVAHAALEEWDSDRPSFRGALRRFFGRDLAKAASELVKGSFDKWADLRNASISAGAAVNIGGAAAQYLGPIGGFGVGVVVHGISSGVSELTRRNRSPYRFLSMAKKKGVVWSIGGRPADVSVH